MEATARSAAMLTRKAWRVDRRWALAATVALFPVLFILDEAVDASFSPVLPGLVALLVFWLAAPYIAMELRALRRREFDVRRTERADISSRYGLGLAVAWFVLWLVFA